VEQGRLNPFANHEPIPEYIMDNRKDTTKKTTPAPKKDKDQSVDLQVEQLEERIAPGKLFQGS
jgi:hypothetical protein